MTKNILHYGLQRSGTNFLENLLVKNYDVKVRNTKRKRHLPFNKHFRLYDEKLIIPEPKYRNDLFFSDFKEFQNSVEQKRYISGFLVVSKDPYSWILSYEKWAKKHKWEKPAHHYIQEYNLFYKKWLQFSEESEKVLLVRYIDLLSNPQPQLERIKQSLKLNEKSSKGVTRFKRIRNSKNFTEDKARYYTEHLYLDQLSEPKREEINNLLDPDVLIGLGYDKH